MALESLTEAGGKFYPGVRRCDESFRPASAARSLPSGLEKLESAHNEASSRGEKWEAVQNDASSGFAFADYFAGAGGFRVVGGVGCGLWRAGEGWVRGGKGEARTREGAAARRTVHFSARVVVLMGEGSFCKKLP